jgi:two-component system, chemotaxis family, sensor kinase CheA
MYMTRAEQFGQITKTLLDYETGDFLLLSDLSDELSSLKDYYLDADEACKLIEKLIKFVAQEMKLSGNERFVENISKGIDLLQKLQPEMDTGQRKEVLAAISGFSCEAEAKAGLKGDKAKNDEGVSGKDEESLQIFLSEVSDRLDQAQAIILELEENPGNLDHIQTLFRIFHTIKGECGFLKIASLGELAHNIESLLDLLRGKKETLQSIHIDLLLEGIDMARRIHDRLKIGDFVVVSDIPMDTFFDKLKKLSEGPCANLGTMLVSEGKMKETDVMRILQKQKESAFTKRFGEIAVKENYLSADELQETLKKQNQCLIGELERQNQARSGEPPRRMDRTDPIIKVRASKVNFLVDMIGELLISMGQMTESTPALMQMRKITRSLQFGAMELRTESLQSLFGNIKRVVRDLSRQLEKNIRLVSIGDDLEIDRNLIEKLEEPLLHLVRNSLDHGIGTPDERTSAGKDPQGTITLKAERIGNSIVITIRDDGHGLNRKRILEKAIEKGMVKRDMAESMSDAQINNLIFASGFSTHDTVTLISGRGVGMDIVRSVVTENRGRIEIDTKEGEFTEFRLVFPLSTAIIDGMITRVRENLFVFPIGSIVESVKVQSSLVTTINGDVEVANLRGETIPILRLHDIFDISEEDPDGIRIGIICETTDRRKFMLVVDEILSKREVVIKSLGTRFRTLRGISSGTVLAGGKIGLVVDIDQIVELSLAGSVT